jgi:outer membrane protein assembly factor BamB
MKDIAGLFVLLAMLSAHLVSSNAQAEEWPKWLGPDGSGISHETGLMDRWPQTGPAKVWSATVGEGYASPIALDGRVYVFAQEGRNDTLWALDAESGKLLWKQAYEASRSPQQSQGANSENGLAVPEATPAIDADRVYTYGGGGDLVCWQLADGKQLWRINILDQTRANILVWAQASSPLVGEKLVYVQGGESGAVAVAVDKISGKIAWKSQATGLAGYAAPAMATVDQKQQLIILGGDTLYGMDPQTGQTIWTQPWKTDNDVNAAMPIVHENRIFITSNYDHGCAMYTLAAIGATKDWENDLVQSQFQTPVLSGDRLYANSAGVLTCIHWPDGKLIWSSRGEPRLGSGGSLLLVGSNKMICLSERGKLSLLDLQPTGAKIISQVALFDDNRVWAVPLLYRGKLYCKGKDQLVCLKVK